MSDHRAKLTARSVSKMQRDWVKGTSVYDLAAEHDVSHTAVLYHVDGLEREATPRMGRPRSFNHERAAGLISQGFSYAEVAARFGVSKSAISQALTRLEA